MADKQMPKTEASGGGITASNDVTPSDYYKTWTAYESLKQAAQETNSRSVWKLLFHFPKKGDHREYWEPGCWKTQPILPIRKKLRDRIQWYYNVTDTPTTNPDKPVPASEAPGSTTRAVTTSHKEKWFKEHQAYFVGHHQLIELVLLFLKPSLDHLYSLIKVTDSSNQSLTLETAQMVTKECTHIANGWLIIAELIRGVGGLDRMRYLQYVPRLLGVSGGNSPLMMSLSSRTANLEKQCTYLTNLSVEDIAKEIQDESPLGQVSEGFIDCLDALSRCWLEHVVTSTTSIGMTKGTKGTPNTILADRVLQRLHASKLLVALGSLRHCTRNQDTERLIGVEMRQLHDYYAYPLAEHYLDLFVDPGPEFAAHSYGWLPREYEVAREEFAKLRRHYRSNLWEFFYTEVRPAFCHTLKSKLLGMDDSEAGQVEIGLASSVTEVMTRIMNSIVCNTQRNNGSTFKVLMPDDEFVTLQRSIAILSHQMGNSESTEVTRVSYKEFESHALNEKHDYDLIAFSLVNSCTQRVLSLDWLRQKDLAATTTVLVDVTQAVGNLPLELGWMAAKPNVFLVGSLVKHARCGEGLGFMTFATNNDTCVSRRPASGWIANLSGLEANRTLDDKNDKLLYDCAQHKWEGGTPCFVESTYVATRICKLLPDISKQHDYVQNILHKEFLNRASHLLSGRQLAWLASSTSNTLAIPVAQKKDKLGFGLDYKIVNGMVYLRIGFGIHSLPYHLDALVQVLEESAALKLDDDYFWETRRGSKQFKHA